jgi:hypothetical protein
MKFLLEVEDDSPRLPAPRDRKLTAEARSPFGSHHEDARVVQRVEVDLGQRRQTSRGAVGPVIAGIESPRTASSLAARAGAQRVLTNRPARQLPIAAATQRRGNTLPNNDPMQCHGVPPKELRLLDIGNPAGLTSAATL